MKYAPIDAISWYAVEHGTTYGKLMTTMNGNRLQLICEAYEAHVQEQKNKAKRTRTPLPSVKFNPYNGQPISE